LYHLINHGKEKWEIGDTLANLIPGNHERCYGNLTYAAKIILIF